MTIDELRTHFTNLNNKIYKVDDLEGEHFDVIEMFNQKELYDFATLPFVTQLLEQTPIFFTKSETNEYFKVSTAKGQSPVTFLEACRSYQQNKEIFDQESKNWYGSLSYYIAKVMKTQQIDKMGKWIESVKTGMAGDRRIRKQNMVIESSK
jgi:hypothetical protein